ncbi:hypothetical protein FLL45_04725 [Aliikangiella marina]|uniref:Uncharacterized protein n=1 Tax=Aliikangiella marina TaxID=1712262 RepID=A0A545TJ63_9GAMM|nr:hypothetical protein [Aliikangiella marina]TQV77255.1 hypothetical protein FLL45_04725 [Aliikangiella marina]
MSKKYTYIKQGLKDDGFNPKVWWFVLVVVSLLGSSLYVIDNFTVVDVNAELTSVGGDVFLKYFFIVVAVERAAAVFVGISRSQNTVDWALRIKRISEVLAKENPSKSILRQVYTREHRLVATLEQAEIIGQITSVSEDADEQDYLGYLTSAKHAYEFQKGSFDSITKLYVSRIVFFAGIVLATLGLSVFGDLFSTIVLESKVQTWFLRVSDILITGGLLGGGSAGLNAMATKMSDFLNKN